MIWRRFRAESGGKFNFKFDDLNWVRESSVAGFVGGAFLRSGGARGPGKALKKVGAKPPRIFEGFPRPPGPARPQKGTPKNPARLPSGTQFDFDRKYGWVLRVPVKAGSLAWALGGEGL